jgi:hypothetical protein
MNEQIAMLRPSSIDILGTLVQFMMVNNDATALNSQTFAPPLHIHEEGTTFFFIPSISLKN